MKKTDVTQPVAMASAFAQDVYSATSTNDFEIPAATSSSADDTCVLDDGFLPITSTALDDGGMAPERKNFNGMFYLSTDQRFYLQNGGFITYNPAVATAIGGYPQDAILGYIDSFGTYKLVRSLIDDNTNNFVLNETLIDGTHWEEIQIGGGGNGYEVGDVIWRLLPTEDGGKHLLDGTLLQYGSYSAFIDYIADLYTADPTAAYFTTEANWQTSVTTYGVCSKFVYDSVNNTVRLPKVTGIVEGTIDATALGDLVEAGLPNITGSYNNVGIEPSHNIASGAFYGQNESGEFYYHASNRGNSIGGFAFDASRSSSIYGNSTTVQPQTIKGFMYIVIATTTKTDIQVNIDEIATDLNGKADVDLSNANNQAKILMSGMAMPSDTYEDFTVGATGASYTAPANGWFCVKCTVSNKTGQFQSGYTTSYGGRGQLTGYQYSDRGGAVVPMSKGQTLSFYYEANTQDRSIRFVYAQGSESEAL